MSNDRHRGKLFDNSGKRKPSQPDMEGDGRIAGKAYTISAWKRDDQLVLSVAPARERGSNSYPPEAFRGTLIHPRGKATDGSPLWSGDITGDDATYAVRAYQRQGKSGTFLELELDQEPNA
jgi:hypothetical protein